MLFLARFNGVYLNKSSQEQKNAANQNQAFTTQLENQFNTEFGNSQQIQASLNKQLQTITNQGLAGQGFTNGEEANLRTDATERAAQEQQQAQQAAGQTIAAKSDGGALTSGAVAQAAEANATVAAAQNAAAQRGITEQNAALARGNVSEGLQGLGSLSGQEASQADSLAGTASSNAANSYNEVQQSYQPSGFWGNLAGAVAGAILPGTGQYFSNTINGPNDGAQSPVPSVMGGSSTPISSWTASNSLAGSDDEDEEYSTPMDLSSLEGGLPGI